MIGVAPNLWNHNEMSVFYDCILFIQVNSCILWQVFCLLQDSVQCALEVSRLQLEEWQSQGPRAQEEALTQKALLQEELVTIRARMCDVSLVCKDSVGRELKWDKQ